MDISKFISKQSSRPSGFFGNFFMPLFFKLGNRKLNNLVFDALSVEESDHLFEIGFGPGILLYKVAKCLKSGTAEGIDISYSMQKSATKKNNKFISEGKVKLHTGDIENISLGNKHFDKIYSVNTIYFWKDPTGTMSKLIQHLRPGGRLFIGFHDRTELERMDLDFDFFRLYSPKELGELLSADGALMNIQINSIRNNKEFFHCMSGTR